MNKKLTISPKKLKWHCFTFLQISFNSCLKRRLLDFICFCIHPVLVDVYRESGFPNKVAGMKDTEDFLKGLQTILKNYHCRENFAHMEHTEMITTGLFIIAAKHEQTLKTPKPIKILYWLQKI